MQDIWNGKAYSRFSEAQRTWGRNLIGALPLRGCERVLDLGCGNGLLTSELAARVPFGSVVGIDASVSMLREARRFRRFNTVHRKVEITRMPFANEFDVVFSNAVLHWVADQEKAQAAICRALRPSGFCRMQFGATGNCPNTVAALEAVVSQDSFRKVFDGWNWPWLAAMPTESLQTLLETLSYEELEVWEETIEWSFESEAALCGWARNTAFLPFMARLSEPQTTSFRDAAENELCRRTRRGDGKYVEIFRRVNVFARKPAREHRVSSDTPLDLP